jgi:DNA invertase Pin-like site-specific DNA recombinase
MPDLLKLLRANASKREALSAERDALIREAKAAGIPVTHIAEAVGLSRAQVHNIIRQTAEVQH